MSKKDQTKTMIDILKAVMLALMTALFGIFVFTVMNYQKIDMIQGIGIGVGALVLLLFLIIVVAFLAKEIKKLGDME
ncbi:hypothetical protein [Helicobacter cappadocius]|uniref:Uncharacterized protein n=1 Tax=Helicobacter cappadocius TaxID=3063998 RepID=A0AA90PLS1_9HELI|nr:MULTISPECIES: hypothetical protein [unclassified Helicobacter]MDO7253899.1 hypothetical protein [Helicobacter sp. faydin-H75]MDP2539760.1 hypothetical protein [Helicobacter sp. faydin-H76]